MKKNCFVLLARVVIFQPLKKMLKQNLDVMWSNKKLATGFVLAASHHRFRVVKWLYQFLTFRDFDLDGSQLFTPNIRVLQFYVKHCNFSKAFWSDMFEEAVMQNNQHVIKFIYSLPKFDIGYLNPQGDFIYKLLIDTHLEFKETDLEKMSTILKEICITHGEYAIKYWKTGIMGLEILIAIFKKCWDINAVIDIWKLGVLQKEHVYLALLDAIHSNNVEKATYLFQLGFFPPQEIRSALGGETPSPNWDIVGTIFCQTMLEFLWSYNIFEKEDILYHSKTFLSKSIAFNLGHFIQSPKLLPVIFECGLFEKEAWQDVGLLQRACSGNYFQSLLFLTQASLFPPNIIDLSICETCQLRLQLQKKRKRCFK